MAERALLLRGEHRCEDESRVALVLQFFGVPWRESTVVEAFWSDRMDGHLQKERVLCSAQTLIDWIARLNNDNVRSFLRDRVHSVFVYGGDNAAALEPVVRMLLDNCSAQLREGRGAGCELAITEDIKDVCGVMSGIKSQSSSKDMVRSLAIERRPATFTPIISLGSSAAFFMVEFHGVPVFLSTASKVIDLNQSITRGNFDVRQNMLEAAPIVMYVRWAFARTAWRSPETNACLIIDDPLLKRRYGFLDYRRLLTLMKREQFATNIAFIPWNCRRSDPQVVAMFRNSPDHFSISVHGCDHTDGEFGTSDSERLRQKVARGIHRMEVHRRLTGLEYNRVMVFPQGVFSSAAFKVLKHCRFEAVVNTEVLSTDSVERPVRVMDVWDVAALNYHDFPLFTRRYPSQGIENVAFDALLGKPCLLVVHHDFLRNGALHLVDFIRQVNGLSCHLSWRSLGEVVKRSYRQQQKAQQLFEVQMFGTELLLENRTSAPMRYLIRRKERDVSGVEKILVNASAMPWRKHEKEMQFEVELSPGESGAVRVDFKSDLPSGEMIDSLRARVSTGVRRYASEIRDNCITRGRYAYRSCIERLESLVDRP
jgi:hypothetical protein